MKRIHYFAMSLVMLLACSGVSAAKTPVTNKSPVQVAQPKTDAEYVAFFKRYVKQRNTSYRVLQQKFNYSIMHLAVMANDPHLIQAASKTGIGINAPDKYGNTALHLAVVRNNGLLVQQLIQSQAKVNAKNYAGQTPLHLATANGNLAMVKYLIKHHANINQSDGYGATAITFARTENHQATEQLLIQLGANPRRQSIIQENRFGEISIMLPQQDPLLISAQKQAKTTLPKFLTLLKRLPTRGDVQILQTSPSGQENPVWAKVIKSKSNRLAIQLPALSLDKHQSQPSPTWIQLREIHDWRITLPNGKVKGNFTAQAMRLAVKRELGYVPPLLELQSTILAGK